MTVLIDNESILHTANPDANTTYRFEGFEYTADSLGRAASSSGTLDLDAGTKRFWDDYKIGTEGQALGYSDDIGFHLGGHQFGFRGGPLNVVPDNSNLNLSAYKILENQLRSYVEQGKRVTANFGAVYLPSNTTIRPDQFVGNYRLNGGPIRTERFFNREGG